jgi:DNA processing protein
VGAEGAGSAGRHRPPASRRAVCIWLGTLASWRPGLVKALVKTCGSIGETLDRDPRELARVVAALAAEGASSRRGRGASAKRAPAPVPSDIRRADGPRRDRAEEGARLDGVLATGPEECAAAAERGLPGTRVVAWCDPLYPPGLRQTADAPLCLFVRAACDVAELERRLEALSLLPAVAVVGTRAPSAYGEEMAALLGRDLTTRGALVVSGMAMGVDAVVQGGAVAAVGGRRPPATVGVLGCGADLVYPGVNAALFRDVARHGLLISEFAWGVPARAWRFPARNRVMAALCRAVVIVEGAERSGALLTADYGLELGREVLAVPGEAGRRLSAAPHRLLRQGAALCESAADVLEAIGTCITADADRPGRTDGDPGVHARLHWSDRGFGPVSAVLRVLERGPMTADQLAVRSGLAVSQACAVLSELEIDGVVRLTDGGRYRLLRG